MAYDKSLNRVYIGTSNSRYGDFNLQPDKEYGSGVLSLDANTGEFKGYFQPDKDYNYRPEYDLDVDIPAAPLIFKRDDGKRILAVGTKTGAFFLIDPDTMKVLDEGQRIRQLLPYNSNNQPFTSIDPKNNEAEIKVGENQDGIFSCATLHPGSRKIFVGLGGYANFDSFIAPFMRCLDWNTLQDGWPTAGTNPPKYETASPPMYQSAHEKGYGSPAVVNDLVFMATTKPALYAFDCTFRPL